MYEYEAHCLHAGFLEFSCHILLDAMINSACDVSLFVNIACFYTICLSFPVKESEYFTDIWPEYCCKHKWDLGHKISVSIWLWNPHPANGILINILKLLFFHFDNLKKTRGRMDRGWSCLPMKIMKERIVKVISEFGMYPFDEEGLELYIWWPR